MQRKWIAMVTGLMLLTAALLPTASAQAATPGNEAKQWKKTVETVVKQWKQPAKKVTYVLYTNKQNQVKWFYSPITQNPTQKPAQKETPAKLSAPSQPVTPAKPNAPSQPVTPAKPNAPSQSVTPITQPQTPANPSAPSSLTADEQRMVQLVNQARQNAGLRPLEVDMELVKVARIKAQDMIANGYFSHTSPTYGSPFDMMRSFGITNWRSAAENIAQNPTVDGAHNSFMNSEGHRNNILNPSFNKVGIGIVDGGPYGKTFVQMFIQSY